MLCYFLSRLQQSRLAGDIMFLTCLFACCQSCEQDILKMNEPIFM